VKICSRCKIEKDINEFILTSKICNNCREDESFKLCGECGSFKKKYQFLSKTSICKDCLSTKSLKECRTCGIIKRRIEYSIYEYFHKYGKCKECRKNSRNKNKIKIEYYVQCFNCSKVIPNITSERLFLRTKFCSGKCRIDFFKKISFLKKSILKKDIIKSNKKIKIYKNHSSLWKKVVKENIVLYSTYAHQISYAEPTRQDPENNDLLQVKCGYCGKWFNPKRSAIQNRIAALDGRMKGEQRLYCSNECKQLCPIFHKQKYSAEETNTKQLSREVQPELRQMVFERDEWTCIKCGEVKAIQCHHIEGIHWNPIESADIDLCVTFCVKCHGEAHKDEGCRYVDLQCKNK